MSEENISGKGPKLSRGMKIFIVAGTVVVVTLGIVYLSIHGGDPEYFRTQIEPDSTLADKELVIKSDTAKTDTAAVDSANKEEEKQAAKVYNSIRGDHRHKVAEEADEESSDETEGSEEQPSESSGSAENEQPSTPQPSGKAESTPTVTPVE